MNLKPYFYATVSALVLSGCFANTVGVTPSQNTTLRAVSPSDTAASQKEGMMQRSLDGWLKEEWKPLSKPSTPVIKTITTPDGSIVQTKTEATQIVTTTTAPSGEVTTTTTPVAAEPEDTTPFTLQKYADKWKVYNENKEKMKEGKPQEPSHIGKLQQMPVIGK